MKLKLELFVFISQKFKGSDVSIRAGFFFEARLFFFNKSEYLLQTAKGLPFPWDMQFLDDSNGCSGRD